MNKTIKSLVLGAVATGMASASYGQGSLNFFTFNSNPAKGVVYLPLSATPIGTGFQGQLFFSDVSAVAAQAPLSPAAPFNSSGVINFGNVVDPQDDAGSTIWYSLVVWNGSENTASAALGPMFPNGSPVLAADVSEYGQSATVKVSNLGGIDAEGDAPFNAPQANGYANFQLGFLPPPFPIPLSPFMPEPSTIVLGGLGAAALLALHKRK